MKIYYIGWIYWVLGILFTPVYLCIHAGMGEAITMYDLLMPLATAVLAGVLTYKPVSMFSVFTVDGTKVQERRIGRRNALREADLSVRDARMYLWVKSGKRWLIVTTQRCESGKAAQELYKQNKAMMIPYEFGLGKSLKSWADQAKELA